MEDFAELSHDQAIVNKLKHFNKEINEIETLLNTSVDPLLYEKMSSTEKIKLNTLLSFSLNSLFWMHLRAEGTDPKTHEINGENDRLKKIMIRAQEVSLSKKPAPRLDTEAAKRFIRSSLWTPNKNESVEENIDQGIENDDDAYESDEFEVVS